MNDIDYGIISWILKFADDTKLFSKVNSANDSLQLQKDLDKLFTWSNDWLMAFNVDKQGHVYG